MRKTLFTQSVGMLLPLALLAGSWLVYQRLTAPDKPVLVSNEKNTTASPNEAPSSRLPTPTVDASDRQSDTGQRIPALPNTDPATPRPALLPDADVIAEAGAKRLSEEEFKSLERRISKEPALVAELLVQFRTNTDLVVAKQLAALLAGSRNPEIVETAASLIYSGEAGSIERGLELLSRIQPHSSAARDIAIDLLSSETNPTTLVSTMNVLATPSGGTTDAQRTLLIDNLLLLSEHPDPDVRSHSVSLIGRWQPSLDTSTVLVQGLSDPNPVVRARSASAMRNVASPSDDAIYALLSVAENPQESKVTRQSALYALENKTLSLDTQSRYEQAVITVRRTRQ